MSTELLVIFVKAPRPGHVKTRLATALGREGAVHAYRTLARATFEAVAAFPHVELRFTPDDAEPETREWMAPGWRAKGQGDGNLGERLIRAFDDAFTLGSERVVIIGSDCPWLTLDDIRIAFSELAKADAVVGPARDGGYWLIGLREPQPSLFAGVDWSTDRVYEQTLTRAQEAGLRVSTLRQLTDVDTEADWREFLERESA